MKQANLNNINCFAPSSRKELIDYAFTNKAILVAVNAEKILNSNESQDIINRNIGYPDGVGAVWALKKKGIKDVIKIPGCELWLDIIQQHVSDKSFYLVGSSEYVINKTVTKLKIDYPEINIVGFRNGYLNESDKLELFEDVAAKKPDVIFVAQGSPRQEFLMNNLHNIHSALYMGLGGSFDVYCGLKKRAPKIYIMLGLEWFYRFVKEPSRIKRNLNIVKFIFKLFSRKL